MDISDMTANQIQAMTTLYTVWYYHHLLAWKITYAKIDNRVRRGLIENGLVEAVVGKPHLSQLTTEGVAWCRSNLETVVTRPFDSISKIHKSVNQRGVQSNRTLHTVIARTAIKSSWPAYTGFGGLHSDLALAGFDLSLDRYAPMTYSELVHNWLVEVHDA